MPTASRLLLVCLSPLALAGVSHAGAQFSPTESRSVHPYVQFQPVAETVAWYWLNPRPTGADLWDAAFTDPNTAVAVGHGTIVRTTDAGYKWEQMASPTMGVLRAVSFADPLTGVAVGNGGIVFGTVDGGITWAEQSSGTAMDLVGVSLADPSNGTAIGRDGLIIRTIDGGANWTVQTADAGMRLNDIDFGGSLNGMIAGQDSTVFVTTDGGATWNPRVLNPYVRFKGVDMTDPRNGTVVGTGGAVFRTTDGGVNWSGQFRAWYIMLDVVGFADSTTGVIFGYTEDVPDPYMLKTSDAGATWQEISAAPAFVSRPRSIAFGNPQTAIIAGSAGYIHRLNDDGISWDNRRKSSFETTLNDVFFVDDLFGVVVGSGDIHRTTNGGGVWETQSVGANVVDVEFTDALHGVAVGDNLFFRTTDGGQSWSSQDMGASLQAVSFIDDQIGFVMSRSQGVIYRTTDGGSNWTHVFNGSFPEDLFFLDQSFGICLDAAGSQVALTHDLGGHWSTADLPGFGELLAVYFTDANNGTVVGRGGLIFKSTNGGFIWTPQTSGTTDDLVDVAFSDSLTGMAVGGSTVIRTTDGGVTWVMQPLSDGWSRYGGVDATGRVVDTNGEVLSIVPPGPLPPELPVISDFEATATNERQVDLSWTAYPIVDVTGFRLLRHVDGAGDTWLPESGMLAPAATSYRDTTVDENVSYSYTLVAFVAGGAEVHWGPIFVTTPALPVITAFTASLDNNHVDLRWEVGNGQYVEGFRVLRQSPGESDVRIPAGGMTWPWTRETSDADIVPDHDYTYTLVAYVTFGGDVRSAPESVSTHVPAITRFDAVPQTERVTLTWEVDSLLTYDGFHLYRSRSGHGDVRIPGTGEIHPMDRSTIDGGVTPGVDYVYTLVVAMKVGNDIRSQPLPVTTVPLPAITRFDAASVGEIIELDWEVDSEDIVLGYRFGRYCEEEGDVWVPADTLLPPGTQTLVDDGVVVGRNYKYTLWVQLTMPGVVTSPDVEVTADPLPTSYALGQNFPNPFNPTTLIPYALPESARVTLEVYDTAGRRIRVIADEDQDPGYRSYEWDGLNDAGAAVASGVYFYRLRAGSFNSTRKMVLVR